MGIEETGLRSFENSACEKVLNSLEAGYQREVAKRITVINFGVDDGGGNGYRMLWSRCKDGYSEVDEYDNIRILTETRMVRKSGVFVKDKAEIASRVGGK